MKDDIIKEAQNMKNTLFVIERMLNSEKNGLVLTFLLTSNELWGTEKDT